MATTFGRQTGGRPAGGRQAGVQDAVGHAAGIGAGTGAGAAPGAVDLANGYAQRAAIDAATFETIRQANGAFLVLVARRAGSEGGAAAFGMPREVAARIATQDATTRRFASECPYTLFNVRFEDAAFWRGVAATAVNAATAAGAAGAEPRSAPWAAGDEPRFVLTAVFLAWHLARHEDLSAALVLGMTPSVRDLWLGLPLQVLEALALASLPHLRARWGAHPRFWPQLLDAAERPGLDHADRVRLLGLQLLATDGCRTSLPHRARRPA
jgi:hypothetical protein